MRRPGSLNWGRVKARLTALPGMVIAGIFIGVSGLMSVSFGYKLGEPSGNALIFALLALGIEGYADLAVPLFWHRLGVLARGGLLAFFALCLAYKLTAANRFAAENLGKRDSAVATASTNFELAKQRVEGLRKTVVDYASARSAAIVQSEIDALLRDPRADGCKGPINGEVTGKVCPKVDLLRGELAKATARDRAQVELAPALAALSGQAPVTVTAADGGGGPVAALLALAGIQVGGWSEFVAHLIMAIVEGGAILVPMLVGMASAAKGGFAETMTCRGKGDQQETFSSKRSPAEAVETGETEVSRPSPRRVTERGERDVADLSAFLASETTRGVGERAQSTALYAHYGIWKQGRGEKPVSLAQFGTVLTHHLGLTKAKIAGKIQYANLSIKPSKTDTQASRALQIVAIAAKPMGRPHNAVHRRAG